MALDFLGTGPTRPFRRDQNDFASATGIALLRARVGQILGTRCDTPISSGELPWRTEFGSKLHLLRHRRDTPVVRALARAWAQEALVQWEPRLIVKRAVLLPTKKPNVKVVDVTFGLVDRSSAGTVALVPDQTVAVTLAE